jgi:hypothetical protein
MDHQEESYRIWAPAESPWSPWVKPLLFAHLPPTFLEDAPLDAVDIDWAPSPGKSALVIDVDGPAAVAMGAALAARGYWPVPLFNGCPGPGEIVPVDPILRALGRATRSLRGLRPRPDAPPVFLSDVRRSSGSGTTTAGRFDNRWALLVQDLPSAARLAERGIEQVVVHAPLLSADLSHVLRRWQDAGIRIARVIPGERTASAVEIARPHRYRSWLYRFGLLAGLRRNAAGGFGVMVPAYNPSLS